MIRRDGEFCNWTTVNVSENGLFVEGEPYLRPGTELDVGLSLPGVRGNVDTMSRARVVWVDKIRGMGLELLEPDQDYVRSVRRFVRAWARHAKGMGAKNHRPRKRKRRAMRKSKPTPPPIPIDLENDPTVQESVQGDDPTIQIDADDLQLEVEDVPYELGSELGTDSDASTPKQIGAYEVLELIATGGIGEVYLAEHAYLGRRVALKRLRAEYLSDELIRSQFLEEGKLANRVRHPNVVEITDVLHDGTDYFYVMEFVEGYSLKELLRRGERLGIARILDVGKQLAQALNAVHAAGLVHRDVKPGNVLLTCQNGRQDIVKLLDFGAATGGRAVAVKEGEDMSILGTPGYVAPEEILGEPHDHRADIYAMGVVLYQMITGRLPFKGRTWTEVVSMQLRKKAPRVSLHRDDVPVELDLLVQRCLSKEPGKRPSDANQVYAALDALTQSAARRWTQSIVVKTKRGVGRYFFLAAALLAGCALGVLATTYGVGMAAEWVDKAIGAMVTESSAAERPEAKVGAADPAETFEPPLVDAASELAGSVPDPGTVAAEEEPPLHPIPERRVPKQERVDPYEKAAAVAELQAIADQKFGADDANPVAAEIEDAGADVPEAPVPNAMGTTTATATATATATDTAEPRTARRRKRHRPRAADFDPMTSPAWKLPSAEPEPAEDAESKLTRARNAVRRGDYNRALKVSHEVLSDDPTQSAAYRVMGIAYSLMGEGVQACEAYRKYLALAPNASDGARVRQILADCDGY